MSRPQTAILIIALLFMAGLFIDQWQEIQSYHIEVNRPLLFLSIALLVPVFFLDALGWYLVLRAMGHHPPLKQTLRVWMVSSITRYIPGGIWAYANRATLSKDIGIGIEAVVISLYIETILLIVSSFIAGLPALLSITHLYEKSWILIFLIPVIGLLLHPRIFSVLRFLPGSIGKKLGSLTLLSPKYTFALYLYYVCFWIIFGAVFVCFVLSIQSVSPDGWVLTASSIALGFLLGFIIIFLPGGIGIRESAIYLLLLPLMPAVACLIISIGSRLWIILGEITSTTIAMLISRNKKTTGTEQAN